MFHFDFSTLDVVYLNKKKKTQTLFFLSKQKRQSKNALERICGAD